MKLVLSSFTFLFLISVNATPSTFEKWQNAAASFLNIPEIEIYSLEVNGPSVSFEYSVEDINDPYLDVNFKCEGTGKIENGWPSFLTLECEEEEPTLWDEF